MGLLRGTQKPELARSDKKVLGRTSDATPIEVVAAQGSRIRDSEGRTYIDFQLGWGVGNLGWSPAEVVARMRAFEGPSYVTPGMLYQPWVELAQRLIDVSPGKLAKVYRCVSGSESVELAMELAVAATGRHKFIALDGAYHGNSLALKSLVGDAMPAHVPACKQLAPPLDESALGRLETLLRSDDIAAFVLEPVVTNLNVLVPDSAFMKGVVELCHEYGALVIADEVACGWGRAGTLFASELFSFEPDILTVAKSLAAGVAPIAATLCTNQVAKAVADSDVDLEFYSTFGWHPFAVEAALATQDFWRDHKAEVLANVETRSGEIRHAVSIMDFKDEPEIRIQGLAIGIGVGDEDYAKAIADECQDNGLLIYPEEDSLVMFPALIIDSDTMEEALAILSQAVQRR